MRESFVFYQSFYEAIEDLEPEDQLKAYKYITEYALTGTEPTEKGAARAVFRMAKAQIDANTVRYENGRRGGRKKDVAEPKDTCEPPEEPNAPADPDPAEPEAEEPKTAESQPKRKTFRPPTLEEVRDYCSERGNDVDPERFHDFYTSKGWMVGKNKMKDWRASVRQWEKPREGPGGPRARPTIDWDSV